jgi:hypothetical protein
MSLSKDIALGAAQAAVTEEVNERYDSTWYYAIGYFAVMLYYKRHSIQGLLWKYTDIGDTNE